MLEGALPWSIKNIIEMRTSLTLKQLFGRYGALFEYMLTVVQMSTEDTPNYDRLVEILRNGTYWLKINLSLPPYVIDINCLFKYQIMRIFPVISLIISFSKFYFSFWSFRTLNYVWVWCVDRVTPPMNIFFDIFEPGMTIFFKVNHSFFWLFWAFPSTDYYLHLSPQLPSTLQMYSFI